MNRPLIASGAILILGVSFVFWQQAQRSTMEKQLDELHEEAAQRGIPLSVSASAGRRTRGAEDRSAAHLVRKVTGLLERVELIERSGDKADEALREQIVDVTVDLMELSPANMRKFLAKLRANPSLSDETKAKIIGSSLLYVAGDNPETALRLYDESKDLFGKGTMVNHIVGTALHSWAETNPEAAMQWLKSNETPPNGITREELQNAVLGGAAKHDAAKAFHLLSEMGLEASTDACEAIATSLADTQTGRESLLKAMRDYVSDMENQRGARTISATVMESVARGVGKNSFESVSQWLDRESLPESDIASFAEGLSWFSTGNETGAWLDWLSQRLPADQLQQPVEGLVGDWVEEDYLAAGKWLTQLPEGPAKTPAIKAYAEAVAAYDPETAVQWAMTISDESARKATLMAIHNNWPTEDADGAASFAAQHGLK
jgi:hypothetical protein